MATEYVPIISLIVSMGALYYSRQKSRSDIKTYEICQRLIRLRRAFLDIEETGNYIGSLMSSLQNSEKSLLEMLVQALETQQANLSLAQDEIDGLSEILSIKAPNLGNLYVNIRGKKDRIGLIYSAASKSELKLAKGAELEPWEQQIVFLDDPKDLLSYAGRLGKDSGQAVDLDGIDMHFEKIVGSIEELTKFINETCEIGNL